MSGFAVLKNRCDGRKSGKSIEMIEGEDACGIES